MSFLLGVALLIGLGLFVGLMGLGFLWFTAGVIGRLGEPHQGEPHAYLSGANTEAYTRADLTEAYLTRADADLSEARRKDGGHKKDW